MSYLTNCLYIQDRNGDYEASEQATKPFVFTDAEVTGSGNACMDFAFDTLTKKGRFVEYSSKRNDTMTALYRAIPSALLMYRLAGLFEGVIRTSGREGYKVTWTFGLKHVATDTNVWFGEWKGGSLFWTEFSDYSSAPKEFREDLERLLTLLVSDTCPHPYDGVVSGSVA